MIAGRHQVGVGIGIDSPLSIPIPTPMRIGSRRQPGGVL